MRGLFVIAAVTLSSCAPVASVPAGYEAVVADAGADLVSQDAFPFSTYSFLRMRCRADGGQLVEFRRSWFLADAGYGLAMQGPNASEWGGGWGMASLDRDSEIEFFFTKSAEAPC